ncbi:MAG: hypothetical protein IT449_09200 [Phycisphaerales bacterium]|nr:hypothetical protein [Phycisphaerales bacterium]
MSVYRPDNAMDNPINWSVKVGRAFAIDIRLHIIFILWVVFQVIRDAADAAKAGGSTWSILGWSIAPSAILFTSVLLHEFGHCFGSRWMGGEADQILLWPLGGLAYVQPPHTPRAHLVTVICGPLVNGVICLLTATFLVIRAGDWGVVPLNPIHPYTPVDPALSPRDVLSWIVLVVFGTNYILLLFNVLLPFYPMDGGQIAHAILWKRRGHRYATLMATTIGMFGAAAFGVVALLTSEVRLLCLAVFGYVTCRQRRMMAKEEAYGDSDLGYDFSRGFGAFDGGAQTQRKHGFFARRRAAQAVRRFARDREEAQRRNLEFDRILGKISKEGMSSLTSRERKFLDGETRRRRE